MENNVKKLSYTVNSPQNGGEFCTIDFDIHKNKDNKTEYITMKVTLNSYENASETRVVCHQNISDILQKMSEDIRAYEFSNSQSQ